MNKTTLALTEEQYHEIIDTMKQGFSGCRANNRVATALILEANLGLRVSDIVALKPCDIVKDGNRWRLDITEQKTKKTRTFTVPDALHAYILQYCLENEIGAKDRIFPITERAIQKTLKTVCDYLGYEGIGTHSFRKFYATKIYVNNSYNILLVQKLLQHSSAAITQRYIGISQKEVEEAIENNLDLL